MKLALTASLLASAAAFAPSSKGKAFTALMSYETAPGAIAPVGFFGTCLGTGVCEVRLWFPPFPYGSYSVRPS